MLKVKLWHRVKNKLIRFIATLMIFRVEIELLYFETFGSCDRVETLCKLYYSEVSMLSKIRNNWLVKLLYNDVVFFFFELRFS